MFLILLWFCCLDVGDPNYAKSLSDAAIIKRKVISYIVFENELPQ